LAHSLGQSVLYAQGVTLWIVQNVFSINPLFV
jgi:hypothetical protein